MAERRRSALWSPEALNDLDSIWDYYAGVAGRRTADDIVRGIGKIAVLLEDQPLAGRTRDEVRADLRSFAANPHVIFYRVIVRGSKSFACWMAGATSMKYLPKMNNQRNGA